MYLSDDLKVFLEENMRKVTCEKDSCFTEWMIFESCIWYMGSCVVLAWNDKLDSLDGGHPILLTPNTTNPQYS